MAVSSSERMGVKRIVHLTQLQVILKYFGATDKKAVNHRLETVQTKVVTEFDTFYRAGGGYRK